MCKSPFVQLRTSPAAEASGMAKGADDQACRVCSAAFENGAKFCPQCGRGLANQPQQVPRSASGPVEAEPQGKIPAGPPAKMAFPSAEADQTQPPAKPQAETLSCHCGQALPDGAQFCLRCGSQIGPGVPRYQLSRKGDQRGTESVHMTGGELTIGKGGDCHLVIADDEYVSRHHAKLVQSDGMVFLEDQGSSNGTFLRVRRPVALEPGDEIVVGTCFLRFEETGQRSNP